MKIIYESDKFEVRKYGTDSTYMLLDHGSKEFVVFEPPQSDELINALQDAEDPDVTDIYLEGIMVLARPYGDVG